ncbi:probable E3 ubiquitin-protein ligase DTX2 isoform X2 [Penaeus japonicus]|nr:probable E3 ubiquitin-protein ligase DTX2 isoform X2 [Penaeus japonicus]XP_042864136.1 probable E3 ubiquitin-protein ligase DTX2 isoform X2 [Penaeus japonicus]
MKSLGAKGSYVPERAGSSYHVVGESVTQWVVPNPPPVPQTLSSAAEELLQKYTTADLSPPDEPCPICMCSLQGPSECSSQDIIDDEGVVKLTQCGHILHKLCARMMAESKQHFIPCPMCKSVHGVRRGNQPDGVMQVKRINDSLPEYECGTIIISYRFGGGIQGRGHPNPGQPYRSHGFPRHAFLPDNERGNKVLHMLEVAWQRRLIFTIGTSITSGLDNVITWNEIHHKTEWEDVYGHGYPDPAYLDNVTMELQQQGVTEADLESSTNLSLD